MNAYLVLFLICFVPLATHRYAQTSQKLEYSPSKPLEPPPPPPITPPSRSYLYRFFSFLLRKTFTRRKPQPPSSSSPPPSSDFTYYASPPVVKVPQKPSPVSRLFSASARARARRAPPPPPPSSSYFRRAPLSSYAAARNADGVITLTAFLGTEGSNVDVDLVVLMAHIQGACKHIGSLLSSPKDLQSAYDAPFGNRERESPRSLRTLSNNILHMALRSSGKVAAISSEEDDAPFWFGDSGSYVVVFDPLDGTQDFDELTPTGTMFSIYYRLREADHLPLNQKAAINVMQRGERLVAAGYGIYSSATMMCFSVGTGLHGFTLDSDVGEFVLTHLDIRIPERGNVYSINDGRYFDWSAGLRHYVDTVRQGRGQNSRRYSAKYISSLVADLHRTILYGGICMNPRAHSHLVHEANALSFLVENGGGRAIDGRRRILEIQPAHLHQRLALFLGSRADVSELESFGDVQQVININPANDDDDDYFD